STHQLELVSPSVSGSIYPYFPPPEIADRSSHMPVKLPGLALSYPYSPEIFFKTNISRTRGCRLPIGSKFLNGAWLRRQPVVSQHNPTGDRTRLDHVWAHLTVSC
ncbi:hypothetical protein PspLS_05851, partial [Pyricularia sp. CBS 133598]